jgi:hypothetical protein
MADDVAITAGSGTTVATDDIAGRHFQRFKLTLGADGVNDGDISTANPMPAAGPAAHDAASTGAPVLVGAYASAAAPADVSADGDAVRTWALRNGAVVTQVSYAGVLATTGLGAAGTGTPRVAIASDSTIAGSNVAHDSADSGNPLKIGAKAATTPSTATMVAAGDRTDLIADLDGSQVVRPMCPLGDILVERVSNTNGTSTASTVFGATASTRNYITSIAVFNDSTTNGYVDFRDGTAGTILFTLPLPAKGGAVINFPVPLRQTTANTALAYDVSAALTTVYISLIGFKSKA